LYLVVFVLVLELGDHGNGVLGLRIVYDSNVKPVERHEGDLAGEFLLVHLLQDLSADLKKSTSFNKFFLRRLGSNIFPVVRRSNIFYVYLQDIFLNLGK
jgi:hypothetical protein